MSVNVAVPRTGEWTGRMRRTGIDKRPACGPILLESTGVRGDTVVDTEQHGRWFQAVYSFDVEDFAHWSTELGVRLGPGNAGENLTLSETGCSDALIGERWAVGDTVLRVTGPRMPCRVFAAFWARPDLIKWFTRFGRPGAYLAVERAGEVRAGNEVRVLSRPEHGVSVAQVFAVRTGGRGALAEHVRGALADLPPEWAGHVAAAISG